MQGVVKLDIQGEKTERLEYSALILCVCQCRFGLVFVFLCQRRIGVHDVQPRPGGRVTAKNEFALTIKTSPGTQCLREISSVLDCRLRLSPDTIVLAEWEFQIFYFFLF